MLNFYFRIQLVYQKELYISIEVVEHSGSVYGG